MLNFRDGPGLAQITRVDCRAAPEFKFSENMKDEMIFKSIAETVTPIFDRERGKRLEMMRKLMLLDQRQLGEKLGVPPQMISKLERGVTPVSRTPVTLDRFFLVFGCLTNHILFGLDRKSFDYFEINAKYWREKDKRKGNRTARLPYRRYKSR